MKKFTAIAIVLCLLLGSGCAWFRRAALRLSEEDLRNAETSRRVARDLMTTWPINSGFIRGALGPDIAHLPTEAVEAMEDLDELCEKQDEYTDFDLGYSLGLRVRLAGAIVKEALKQYAPDILGLLPAALP